MTNFLIFLKGKKSYLLAAALFAYTIGGYFTGHLTLQDALGLLYASGITASIRAAIASHQHAVNEVLNVATQVTQSAVVQEPAAAPEVIPVQIPPSV